MEFHPCGPRKLPALYRKYGLFFYAALLDGFANCPMEAMACGSIVVSARNAGTQYLNSDNSFFFCPGDNREAIKILCSVLDHWQPESGAWKKRSELAHKTSLRYDWESTVDQLEAAMRRMVA
jgi:glycosyltransferase involved in cell wall biosynthesis